MNLCRRPVYDYQKGGGPENGFYHFGELESKPFTFTAENNHGTGRGLSASASFDAYCADVKMVLTPVGATAWISMTTGDEWKDAMIKDERGETRVSGVDYVLEYNAYVDSVPQPGWLDEAGGSLRGSFMVPVGAHKILPTCVLAQRRTPRGGDRLLPEITDRPVPAPGRIVSAASSAAEGE
jgi:hypothetical protein